MLALSAWAPAAALDMRGETIYMIMVDRFFDGDPANNTAVNPNQYSPDQSEWGKYFGGDLEGIRQKLDYLQSVGATAIWITPVCENDPYLLAGGAPYHGYDMMDLYRVEPHFGAWPVFDAVADGLHSRGMKLILDVNLNNGGYTGSGNLCRMYKDGLPKADYNRDYQDWYHHLGTMPQDKWDDPYWMLNANIFGMADLNQDQAIVRRYLLNGVAKWVWHGVDAFRLDAAKHVPVAFVRTFTDQMNILAGWLGRPGAYAFAEYYGGGANNQASIDWSQQAGAALFDFHLAGDIRNIALENMTFWDLWNTIAFRQTAYGSDFQGGPNSNWQVIWFDSHDWQRLMTVLLAKYGSEVAARNRVDQAIVLTLTLPGIPCIYYGTEQYLHNDTPGTGGIPGADPYNRPMMASWDTDTSAARTLATLSNVRKYNPALQYGDIQQRYITSSLFCYSRQSGNSAVVVALNNSGIAQDMPVTGLPLPDGSYEDVLHPGTWINVSGSSASFHLEPTSSAVLVRWPAGQSASPPVPTPVTSEAQSADPPAEPEAMTFDGRNIPADFAGSLIATQDNFTWFGDNGHPAAGSELDQLFLTNDASALKIGITGNLETNGNCWLVFLQTAPDGTPTLTATAGPPSGVVESLAGTMMDEGFSPNWLLAINTYNGVVYADLVDLVNNSSRFLGAGAVGSGSGVLSGGVNPNGALVAFDNSNTAGVTSDPGRSIAQTQADAATATTGAEILVPFADIELSTHKPKILVLLTGSSGYISGQSLPGFGGRFYNPGAPPIDFERAPALQFAEVTLEGLNFTPQPSVAAAKALPDGTAVLLEGAVVTGQYYAFSSYYIESGDRSSGIRVRDLSGILPAQGKTVDVQGFLTTHEGERIINAVSTVVGPSGTIPKPLGMANDRLRAGLGSPGLTGTGLLVSSWGRVTDRGIDEIGNDFFYFDDGAGIWDGSYRSDGQPRFGIRATINYVYPEIGSFVRVTGCAGIQMIDGVPQRRILPRGALDVRAQ